MMEANTSRQKSVCKTEGPELSIVRVGKASDVPELLRLFSARQAEAGDLAEVDARKVMEAFEAAIYNRRSMVMVAPGADGRLTGFVLFGLVERWWSAAPAISELCLCVDQGHARSRGVRELRKFAGWARRKSEPSKPVDTATETPEPSKEQNCSAQAPQANAPSDFRERVQGDLGGVMDLLQAP
jgi:hypothetical protein